jgi:hypothetical protein
MKEEEDRRFESSMKRVLCFGDRLLEKAVRLWRALQENQAE